MSQYEQFAINKRNKLMNHEVTASFENLMDQSINTAEIYLMAARNAIDNQFYEGCSLKHPELVAAFMTTSALDYQSSALMVSAQKLSAGLSAGLDEIATEIMKSS